MFIEVTHGSEQTCRGIGTAPKTPSRHARPANIRLTFLGRAMRSAFPKPIDRKKPE